MFRTTEFCELKSALNTISVPSGTLVTPIQCGGNEIRYVIICPAVLKQQNTNDRNRYLYVPTSIVENIA